MKSVFCFPFYFWCISSGETIRDIFFPQHFTGEPAMVLTETASARFDFDLKQGPQIPQGSQGSGLWVQWENENEEVIAVAVSHSELGFWRVQSLLKAEVSVTREVLGSLMLQFGIQGAHRGATWPCIPSHLHRALCSHPNCLPLP